MRRYGLVSRPPLVRDLAEASATDVDKMRFIMYRASRWLADASADRAVPFWGRVACSVAAKILEKESDRMWPND